MNGLCTASRTPRDAIIVSDEFVDITSGIAQISAPRETSALGTPVQQYTCTGTPAQVHLQRTVPPEGQGGSTSRVPQRTQRRQVLQARSEVLDVQMVTVRRQNHLVEQLYMFSHCIADRALASACQHVCAGSKEGAGGSRSRNVCRRGLWWT